MSILSICQTIAEKIHAVKQKGYDEGYADGSASGGGDMSAWWDSYFANQQELKTNYAIAGAGWHEGTFKPNRTINAEVLGTTTPATLFAYTGFVTFPAYLEDGVTPILDTSGCTKMNSLFSNCKRLEQVLDPIDLSSCTNMSYFLAGTKTIKKVTLRHVENVTNWSSAFGASEVLTDIGQESDEFGYFSASVDLSKTKIDFGTPKMSLCDLSRDWRQENSYLRFSYDSEVAPVLTINQMQLDAAQGYLNLEYAYEDGAPVFEMNLVNGCCWELEVV